MARVDLLTRLKCLLGSRYLRQWPELLGLVLDHFQVTYRSAALLEKGYLELLPWYNISNVERTPLQTGESPWRLDQPFFEEEEHFLISPTEGGPLFYLGFESAPSQSVRQLFEAIGQALGRPDPADMVPPYRRWPVDEEEEDLDPPLAGSRPSSRHRHSLPSDIADQIRFTLGDWDNFHEMLAHLHNWKWACAALLHGQVPVIVHGWRPQDVLEAGDWLYPLEDGFSLFLGIRKVSRGTHLKRYHRLLMATVGEARPLPRVALPRHPERCLEEVRALHPEVSWLALYRKGQLLLETGEKGEGEDLRITGGDETHLVLRAPRWQKLVPTLVALQPLLEELATGRQAGEAPTLPARWDWPESKPAGKAGDPLTGIFLDLDSSTLQATIRQGVLSRRGADHKMTPEESRVLLSLLQDLDVRKTWQDRPGLSPWSLLLELATERYGLRLRGGTPPPGLSLLERLLKEPARDLELISRAGRAFRDGDVSALSELLEQSVGAEVAPLLAALGARAIREMELWIGSSEAALVIEAFPDDEETRLAWLAAAPSLTSLPYQAREALLILYARFGLWQLVAPALWNSSLRRETIRLLGEYPHESQAAELLLEALRRDVPTATQPNPTWKRIPQALTGFPAGARTRALEILEGLPDNREVLEARQLLRSVRETAENLLRWLAVRGDEAEVTSELSEQIAELEGADTFEVSNRTLVWNARRLHELTLSEVNGELWERYRRSYPGEQAWSSGEQVNCNFVRQAIYLNSPLELQLHLRVSEDCSAARALHDAAWLIGEADDPKWLQARHPEIRDLLYRLLVLRGWEEARFLSPSHWRALTTHPDWPRFELEDALMRGKLERAEGLLTQEWRDAGYQDVLSFLRGDTRPRVREWTFPLPILFFRLACFENGAWDLLRRHAGGQPLAAVCPWAPYKKLQSGEWHRFRGAAIGYVSPTRTWLYGGLQYACELGEGAERLAPDSDDRLGEGLSDHGMNLAARKAARRALGLPAPTGLPEAAGKARDSGYHAMASLLEG